VAVIWQPRGTMVGSLTAEITSCTFSTRAIGGYWDATLTLDVGREGFEEWIADGLGRHIEIYGDAMQKVWEGWVNRIDGSAGALSVTRGPLLDVANRVAVVYREKDTSASPPTLGAQAITTIAENAASQLAFGIFEQIVSGGELDNAVGIEEADQLRDTYLAENAWPRTGKAWNAGNLGGGGPSVTLYCLGYVHLLAAYTYEDVAGSGTVATQTKLATVLDADPNGLFASTNADLGACGQPIARYEGEGRTGWDVLQDIIEMGGPTNGRWLLMVGNDRRVTYEAAPETVEYLQSVYDADMQVTTVTGDIVEPWDVKPGKWLLFSDFLTGLPPPDYASLEQDMRTMFIEEVVYNMPRSVSLRGNPYDTVKARLAQLTMTGRILA